MACQGGSPSPHQQPKTVVKARSELGHSERIYSAGRDFNRQSNSIQAAAQFRDLGGVRVVEFERVLARHSALDKQLNRRKRQRFRSGQRLGRRRRGQGLQAMNMLALHPQWLSACRQETRSTDIPEHSLSERCDGLDHVLTIIEHEEDLLVPQK